MYYEVVHEVHNKDRENVCKENMYLTSANEINNIATMLTGQPHKLESMRSHQTNRMRPHSRAIYISSFAFACSRN